MLSQQNQTHPSNWTCRHVWEIVTVISGTDGVQTSNRRECPQPRPICEREGGESWVSSLRRGSLFPVLKISVRHRAGDWADMKIKAERKSNVCWRQRQMKRWLGDISIECLGSALYIEIKALLSIISATHVAADQRSQHRGVWIPLVHLGVSL